MTINRPPNNASATVYLQGEKARKKGSGDGRDPGEFLLSINDYPLSAYQSSVHTNLQSNLEM